MRQNPDDKTCYIFDIRSAEEFANGYLAGSIHIAGGQLLQTTERYAVVQNADIVLVDSDGVWATTAAVWLRRMGWKNVGTFMISGNSTELVKETAVMPRPALPEKISISAAQSALKEDKATLCDLRSSYTYRRGHIKGSAFLTRADLDNDVAKLPARHGVILLAEDLEYAAYTGRDLQNLGRKTQLLEGSFENWKATGGACSQEQGWFLSRPVDTYFESDHYDSQQVSLREHHAYLNWEIALIGHTVDEPAVKFDIR